MGHEHSVAVARRVCTYELAHRRALISSVRQSCACGAHRRVTIVTVGEKTTTKYSPWKSGQGRKVQ